MAPGFQNLPAKVTTRDGRNCVFLECLLFLMRDGRLIRMRAGGTTDGASVPRWLWFLFAPFGRYWPAAALHDGAYRLQLDVFINGAWVPLNLSEPDANRLIYEAMTDLGDGTWTRHIIYFALRMFGRKAYIEDRKEVAAGKSV